MLCNYSLKFLLIISAIMFISCSDESANNSESDQEIAEAIWQQINQENYDNTSSNWSYWPGTAGKYLPDTTLIGSDPHIGPQAFQTFVNSSAITGLNNRSFPLTDNSIIVKENYTIAGPDTVLAALTVMLKKNGYDPDNNNWFWAKYAADGTIQANGKVAGCIGCHSGANSFHTETDYLWTRLD